MCNLRKAADIHSNAYQNCSGGSILTLLKIKPSPESLDYVKNKKQFHLYTLLTEQRHPKTWNLSFLLKKNVKEGLRRLFSVDEDISRKIRELAEEPKLLEQAAESVVKALEEGRKIYIYGCGATGRLAKQLESTLWRPFWRRAKNRHLWEKLKEHLPLDIDIEERLIGEMTGGDRALISSLEGFEDLQIIGSLQLKDRGIERGDVVFCITEGGETSSVIGAILAALEQYGNLDQDKMEEARDHLYFIYNNPDHLLKPFERSRVVIEDPAITKINLTTGPQAITGSTRMQATTIETFIMAMILEEGIWRALRKFLGPEDLGELGFSKDISLKERLLEFSDIKRAVDCSLDSLGRLVELEAETYRRRRYATYFAKKAIITVFIDSTERSPTFKLFPLDTTEESERRCWVQVWTESGSLREAWRLFLGREFRGLEEAFYRPYFINEIKEPFLKEAALQSLSKAGNAQEFLYDFSFSSSNIERRGPEEGDLGVVVCVDEEVEELNNSSSSFRRFISLFKEKGAKIGLILISDRELERTEKHIERLLRKEDVILKVSLDKKADPFGMRKQIALKMLLNAHSTSVMAKLGRVIGNTMTYVSPSNLKLIGRATFLIMSHVNDTISQPEWLRKYGKTDPITFSEANAVLFEAMEFVRSRDMGEVAEVALSIIRVLEALKRNEYVSWQKALSILETEGLEAYLLRHNPGLKGR